MKHHLPTVNHAVLVVKVWRLGFRSIATHPSISVRAITEIDPVRRKKRPSLRMQKSIRTGVRCLRRKGIFRHGQCIYSDHMHAAQAFLPCKRYSHLRTKTTHARVGESGLLQYAHKNKIVTQMGIQCHSTQNTVPPCNCARRDNREIGGGSFF